MSTYSDASSPTLTISNTDVELGANNYQGDPRAEVQSLLDSGKMSQQTYSKFNNIANAIQSGNPMAAIASLFSK